MEEAAGRAYAYGVLDPAETRDFAASSLELDFSTGYYRRGLFRATAMEGVQGFAFNRNSSGVAYDADGALVAFMVDQPRITTAGLTIEPARTNKLACFNANPREPLGSTTVEGMTDDGVKTLSVVDDAAAIATAGLMAVCMTGKAYRVDNSGGVSAEFIAIDGATGNTRPHALSCYMRADVPFTDTAMNAGTATGAVSVGADYARVSVLATPANATSRMLIRVPAGRIVTFILPQMEEGPYATTPIITEGAPATRAQDFAVLSGFEAGDGWTLNVDAAFAGGSGSVDPGRRVIAALAGPDSTESVVLTAAADGSVIGVTTVQGQEPVITGSPNIAAAGALQELAFRIETDNVRLARNAQLADLHTDVDVPVLLTRLGLGVLPWGDAPGSVVIRRAALLPIPASDRDLVAYVGGPRFVTGERWEREGFATFSHRDSAKTFIMGGRRFVANGYQAGGVAINDIWSSLDGRVFVPVNQTPPYDDFSHMQPTGPNLYAFRESMWKSTDAGVTWEKIIAAMPFALPFDSPTWVADGKLRCLAGSGAANDATAGIWEFDELAVSWSRIATPDWGARMLSVVAELDGDLYLQGGVRIEANVPAETGYPDWTTLNDLWTSDDGGVTWSLVVESLPFRPRVWPAMTAFEGSLYLMGGWDNLSSPGRNLSDTFRSADGATWERVDVAREFLERHAALAYVTDGQLLMVSGNANDAGGTLRDIDRFYPTSIE